MAADLNLRLIDTGLPDGELSLRNLAALADALQLLATRIGRRLADQERPGRTQSLIERATELRLRGLGAGSTMLDVSVGEDDVLHDQLEMEMVGQIFDLLRGMATNEPPTWTTPLIGEAVAKVLDALDASAQECVVSSRTLPANKPVRVRPSDASREVWINLPRILDTVPGAEVSGVLDLVNLRSARFRIRDDVGNDIALEQVGNAGEAARLVGQRVTVTGEAQFGSRGQITKLLGADVIGTQLPAWSIEPAAAAFVADATSPPTGGIDGLAEEEIRQFLASVRGE